MTKVAYVKCLCTSAQRQLAIKLTREGYTLKITDQNKEAKQEALTFNTPIPFVVEDGIATAL